METYFIKIQGKANIPEALEIDRNYKISADCSITQVRRDSNENGEYNVTYKAEPVTVEILSKNGTIIKAKDPRKNSQKIRNYLFKHYTGEGIVEDFDALYDAFTQEVMLDTPQLMKRAVARVRGHSGL